MGPTIFGHFDRFNSPNSSSDWSRKVGPVFEFFEGRFGFLSSQGIKNMDTMVVQKTLSETFSCALWLAYRISRQFAPVNFAVQNQLFLSARGRL